MKTLSCPIQYLYQIEALFLLFSFMHLVCIYSAMKKDISSVEQIYIAFSPMFHVDSYASKTQTLTPVRVLKSNWCHPRSSGPQVLYIELKLSLCSFQPCLLLDMNPSTTRHRDKCVKKEGGEA